MQEHINAFFSFSRSERRGIFLLIGILFTCELGFYLIAHLESPIYVPDAKTLAELRNFEDSMLKIDVNLSQENRFSYERNASNAPFKKRSINYFPFDPNTLNEEGWQKLGFSEKQTRIILNYRNSGKQFRSVEDLERVFVIGKEGAQRLAPYAKFNALIEDSSKSKKYTAQNRYKPILKTIELNSADTLELTELRGIGPSWALRIVRYRDRLGGYITLNQLFDLRGMSDTLMDKIAPQLVIDTTLVMKLNVNEADVESLRNHPYIHSNLANSIVNYRLKHGPYKSVNALLQLRNLKEEDLIRLRPYIRTE